MNGMMFLHIWQNFRIELPAEWEMLQFSRNPKNGRCAFADRYQFRCELIWRQVSSQPDLKRMISDYKSMLRDRENWKRIKDRKVGEWLGFRGKREGEEVTRYSLYLESVSTILEVVLMWPAGCEYGLEKKILKSVCADRENGDGQKNWKAFGLNLSVASDLSLDECSVMPADVDLCFRNLKGDREEKYSRKGFVDYWLKDSPGEWFGNRIPERVRLDKGFKKNGSEEKIDGHEIYRFKGLLRLGGAKGLLRMKIDYQGACWICPKDNRLYSVEISGACDGDKPGSSFASNQLICCEGNCAND